MKKAEKAPKVKAELVKPKKAKKASLDIDLADLLIAIQCMELVEKNCKNAGIVTEVLAKFRKLTK